MQSKMAVVSALLILLLFTTPVLGTTTPSGTTTPTATTATSPTTTPATSVDTLSNTGQ